jgi:hypothetical protein
MPFDPVFKELLRAFFREFLELFFPEAAARLDLTEVRFLDKEVFTDLPEGSLREPDLVAETRTKEGEPEVILVHVEVQAQKGRAFPYRMFEYYALLRLRTKKPVYPVALMLVGGTGGITREVYEERLLGESILAFRYATVSLPDLAADSYLDSPNPLGPALAALMRPSRKGRARQKLESLLRVVRLPVDEARKSLLAHVVESYLKLTRREREDYDNYLRELPQVEVETMVTIFEQRGYEKGMRSGKEQGARTAKRAAVAKVLRARFRSVPADLDSRLEAIEDLDVLERLFDRSLTASAIEEVGIPERADDE